MQPTLIPDLFRTEYRKLVAVLCKQFGIYFIGVAEDIVSDTFATAAELWGQKGLPPQPSAWLYTVAKNKTKDYIKHHQVFTNKVAKQLQHAAPQCIDELEIDLSTQNIADSQLAMMFAICHPSINEEAQIGLALNILCGFGAAEIAKAFLTNTTIIYKRLSRAKEKLRTEGIAIECPAPQEISKRLPPVLTILYLLFNEGYHSNSAHAVLKKELCIEAMRLTYMLLENAITNQPMVAALMALMCFHASRFEARTTEKGEIILYEDQDETQWNQDLIQRGIYYLEQSSKGGAISKYHLEAVIGFEHTQKADTPEKWQRILLLYNKLLLIEYSPITALNRTYALSKVKGKQQAIKEAEKLVQLEGNYLYHLLLGNLYKELSNEMALFHLKKALQLSTSLPEQQHIQQAIEKLMQPQ